MSQRAHTYLGRCNRHVHITKHHDHVINYSYDISNVCFGLCIVDPDKSTLITMCESLHIHFNNSY